ncbi:RHS repeat-associated core domain-containing protein [Trinickia dinghuensis]|nr:RHS repeat-associated core domain-containing protein [Trinickia dinghuensis]
MLTGLGIDEVLSRTDSLGTRSFVTDALGSTVALTDGSGAIKTSYQYEPYGNASVSGETGTNAVQFTGRENDGTGLYYYRGRYYHPGFGRFIAEDPIGFAGGTDLYAYVGGSPINRVDPLGLAFMPSPGSGGSSGDPFGLGGGGLSGDPFGLGGNSCPAGGHNNPPSTQVATTGNFWVDKVIVPIVCLYCQLTGQETLPEIPAPPPEPPPAIIIKPPEEK